MAVEIGDVSCDIIDGLYSGPTTRGFNWETPGIDGRATMKTGLVPGRFRFRAIKFGTLGALNTWREDIEALKHEGSQDIKDTVGNTHSNAVIEEMSQLSPIGVIESGSSKYRGELIITGYFRVT